MSKFECKLHGGYDFDEVLNYFHEHLMSSLSATFEDQSEYRSGSQRTVVRVYERYTIMGDNRLSLTVMMTTDGREIFLSAIPAAGSGGLCKVVGWGEDSFLNAFIGAAEQFPDVRIVTRPR